MFRFLVVAGLVVALLVPSSAGAAVAAGTYKGRTAQGAVLSFRVMANKRRVDKALLERATLECDSGGPLTVKNLPLPSSRRGTIRRSFLTMVLGTGDDRGDALVYGTIRAPRASGTVQVSARLNEQREFDPRGSTFCDSGLLKWTARRR